MVDEKPTVLLVDDDRDILWMFGRHLLRCGFIVTTCLDGEEAMEVIGSKGFDLLITDLRMPRIDGLALIEWARENRKDMKAILVTAFGSQMIRKLSEKQSVVYLEKPVDLEDLVDTIIEILSTSDKAGFRGTVGEMDLLEYLQLILVCKRTVVVRVTAADGTEFLLFFNDGRIEHAEGGDVGGEEAFFRCVESPEATFTTLAWVDPPQTTIDKPTRDLLTAAAAKRQDRSRS